MRTVHAMEDTWISRDLPVLDAVVRLLDEPGHGLLFGRTVAEHTGLGKGAVESALLALSPDYVRLGRQMSAEGGIDLLPLDGVTAEARRAVGQWPTADSLVAQLIDGFNDAADREPDPERKNRLQAIASGLGGSVRDVAVDIVARVIEHKAGLG